MIELTNIWKKYMTKDIFRRSVRDDIVSFFTGRRDESLREDEFWALRNINIKIRENECVGIYGHNGAGKTTLLKLIASVTYPTIGEVKVNGRIAPLISIGAGFHKDLNARENIYVNGTIIGMTLKEIDSKIDEIIEFSGIDKKFLTMPIKKFSSGMRVRLGFAIAVHSSADIMLMDEVLSVGDESFTEKSLDKIYELKRKKTMVFVTHSKSQMQSIADRVIVLDHGEMIDEYVPEKKDDQTTNNSI